MLGSGFIEFPRKGNSDALAGVSNLLKIVYLLFDAKFILSGKHMNGKLVAGLI